ncbi:hypothetical protein Ancab_021929 [Ancistrocladus abbreviatus]
MAKKPWLFSDLLASLLVFVTMMMVVRRHHCSEVGGSLEPGWLKVSTSMFTCALESTIDGIHKTIPHLSRFVDSPSNDFGLSNAISACQDLINLSAEELSWALSASQQTGEVRGTGNLSADLTTWLSAALGNQDTCLDEFQGTDSVVKEYLAKILNQITASIREILNMVHEVCPPIDSSMDHRTSGDPATGTKSGGKLMAEHNNLFPSWITPEDQKLLQVDCVPAADVVVALDGTGNFTKVMDAVLAAPDHSSRRFVIYIKRGVYNEYVEIKTKKSNIMMVGDGIDVTIITGNRNNNDGWKTYLTATFGVKARGFIARDLTIENTAGPMKHQAVAFRSDSDLSALYRCAFRGYQDTLYMHAGRQFYRECIITGTIDFIFGKARAVLQSCLILARRGLTNQKNTITAQGKNESIACSGFSIQFCNISADSDLLHESGDPPPTYLGRPWKPYSTTIVMESYLGDIITPAGWLEWDGEKFLETLFYAEYMNFGPGASVDSRVKWPGFHILNSSAQAMDFTVSQFIEGDFWLPATGVRYDAGLLA